MGHGIFIASIGDSLVCDYLCGYMLCVCLYRSRLKNNKLEMIKLLSHQTEVLHSLEMGCLIIAR